MCREPTKDHAAIQRPCRPALPTGAGGDFRFRPDWVAGATLSQSRGCSAEHIGWARGGQCSEHLIAGIYYPVPTHGYRWTQ
jgi:hypothetical protein